MGNDVKKSKRGKIRAHVESKKGKRRYLFSSGVWNKLKTN